MGSDLDDLAEKIRRAQEARLQPAVSKKSTGDPNARAGLQAGMEFSAAIILGALLGYGLDQWFSTRPAFTLIFFFLGVITGFYNVYRVTQNLGTGVGISQLHQREKDAKTAPDSDESGSETKG